MALVVWPWYIKDLRQFKVYYHDAKKTIWREQQGKGTGSCWTALWRLSLPLWIYWYALFIAVKAKLLKTKFKNITEWQALQPTLSNKLVLPLFLSSNSVCGQFVCTHHFSTWQSIAIFLLYSLLIRLLLGMNSLLLIFLPCVVTSISPWIAIEEKQLSRIGSYMQFWMGQLPSVHYNQWSLFHWLL